jgi:hypothetical protein
MGGWLGQDAKALLVEHQRGGRNWIYDKENIVMKLAAIAAISLATPAMAQEACPASHDDYRHPTPVWGGFGNQVNACPRDKIEVAAKLVVSPNNSFGILVCSPHTPAPPKSHPRQVSVSG